MNLQSFGLRLDNDDNDIYSKYSHLSQTEWVQL